MLTLAWVAALVVLTLLFQHWLDTQHNPNARVVTHTSAGVPEVILQRNRRGHYVANGTINGVEVTFLLDTGASDVSIPGQLARRLKLARGPAATYNTANGPITAYRTRLARVALGELAVADVIASINPNTQGEEVLLGMSFLKHLEFTQRGDTLILRPYK